MGCLEERIVPTDVSTEELNLKVWHQNPRFLLEFDAIATTVMGGGRLGAFSFS